MEKLKFTKEEEKMDALEYLEHKKKQVIEKIEALADSGTQYDAVKLKALQVLLNKVMPDRTKLDVDIKNNAPYDMLMKNLKGDK